MKSIDEIRRRARSSSVIPLTGAGFAVTCLVLATGLRWAVAFLHTDALFMLYLPAVFCATITGGLWIGVATAVIGGMLGVGIDFSGAGAGADATRLVLLGPYLAISALTMWGVEHWHGEQIERRRVLKRLGEEEAHRKLLVAELQHRLKNKLSTVHAVMHQVLHNEPQIWARVDPRLRSLATTDDLISKIDNAGCDIRDLLMAELGPYGHVRFILDGDRLFLPAKLAVTMSLMFHELATNASKYGAFSAPRGLLRVSWTVSRDRLTLTWDETEGPTITHVSLPGFGSKLLKSALSAFDGKSEISYLKSGVHCIMQCRIPAA